MKAAVLQAGAPVAAHLVHGQPHQRLDAGQIDRAALLRVLVVEFHLTPVLYFLLRLMNSIQLVAQQRLEPREMPMPPDPGPGEVLVRLRAVGICGSDMHWYKEGGIGDRRAPVPAGARP